MSMKFTVLPHVHWDREWYFTQQKAQVYLNRYLTDVMDQLDADPRITQYLFDAQTSIIDDYLADHPEREQQLKRLITKKRLLTGPWYSQCDQMVVHGESMVRNLLYGTRRATELGHCFPVGYAPDCFGQAAQTPQIMAGFGIPYVLFKRGIETAKIPSDDFLWESEDGSKVYAYHLLDYMSFRNPSSDAEKNIQTVKKIEAAYEPRSLSKHAFLFNGFDQHPLRKDIVDLIEAMGDEVDASFDDVEEVLAEMAATPGLPVYTGELTLGETTRAHKSIYSSRADIKTLNSKVENQLVRIAEPLQAINYALTGREERSVLKRAWKQVMENSAHDALGCCNSDEVNRNIIGRFNEAMSSATAYEQIVYRQIAEGAGTPAFGFQAYNFLPCEREQEVVTTLITPSTSIELVDGDGRHYPVEVLSSEDVTAYAGMSFWWSVGTNNSYENPYKGKTLYRCEVRATLRVPAMGYETFHVVEAAEAAKAAAATDVLENAWLRVSANADGTLDIVDKRTGHVYHKVFELVDDIDAGDSYNWSWDPEAPLVVSSKGGAAKVEVSGQTMRIAVTMVLPANREERIAESCTTEEQVVLEVTLPSDRPVLNVRAKIDNAAVEHRLRVLVPADIPSAWSHADQTFGLIDRPTSLAEQEARWVEDGWDERPITVEPMQSFCYLEGDGRLVEVITDSVKEYQVVGDELDTLAYTLFRSFTKMGRADLPDRPGRESGKTWDTPDAALLGEQEYTFAIAFPESVGEAVRLASEYTTPLRVHQKVLCDLSQDEFVFGGFSPEVPARYSAFSLEGDIQTSIYKLAEDEGKGAILRFTVLSEGGFAVHTNAAVHLTNLAENDDQELDANMVAKRNQIVTLRLQ